MVVSEDYKKINKMKNRSISYSSRQFFVEIDISIKTYDIDAAGHVNNIVFVRWLEDLRLAWLDKYLPLEKLLKENLHAVVRSTHIEYKRQLHLLDKPKALMYLSSMERDLIWTLRAEFSIDKKIVAAAEQKGVLFNLKTQKMVSAPSAILSDQ